MTTTNKLSSVHRRRNKIKERPVTQDRDRVHVGSVDYTIALVVVILVLIGVVMVFSASYMRAASLPRFQFDPFHIFRRDIVFAGAGLIVMAVMANVSYRFIRPLSTIIFIVTVALLVAVLFIGEGPGGVNRWIDIPFVDFRFQPSELAKLSTIFMLAYVIERYPSMLMKVFSSILVMGIFGLNVLLIIRSDFGTAVIIAVFGIGIVFIASKHIMRFILVGAAGLGALGVYLWQSITSDGFRGVRIQTWLDPFSDPSDAGFQIVNSLYAIASGSWLGLGIGQSRMARFIPEAQNDMIFAIIVEELGFFGAGMILLFFGVLIWRGVIVARNAPDTFSALVAYGIVLSIGVQTLINVAVVTNTIPNTGITLPFISYGGTSMLVTMAMSGILLNISRYTAEKNE